MAAASKSAKSAKAGKGSMSPSPRAVRAKTTTAAPPPTPLAPDRDFLVIYEEDDEGLPGDDHLVLDIEGSSAPQRGELDVKQRLDLELSNDVSRTGTIGFIFTCLGAITGVGLMLFFLISYPSQWYDADHGLRTSGSPFKPAFVAAFAAFVLMFVGTMMTNYGRRIQARGNLSHVRIVEKASQQKAQLR